MIRKMASSWDIFVSRFNAFAKTIKGPDRVVLEILSGLFLERVMGIEPTLRAWEAPVLPLNYTRIRFQLLFLGSILNPIDPESKCKLNAFPTGVFSPFQLKSCTNGQKLSGGWGIPFQGCRWQGCHHQASREGFTASPGKGFPIRPNL